jgi:hypothetical protein
MWWHIPVITALRRVRQEDGQSSRVHSETLFKKKKKERKDRKWRGRSSSLGHPKGFQRRRAFH